MEYIDMMFMIFVPIAQFRKEIHLDLVNLIIPLSFIWAGKCVQLEQTINF